MSAPDHTDDRFGEWAHCSVLVVDDEPGMVSFLQRALSVRGTAVDTAGSVEQAVPQVAGHRYDVVLLDIALPGRSGVQWLHELREQGYTGEVILMTAYADLDTAIDALRAGASDFLLKPFSLAQVLNAIQRCLERSRLVRENFVLRRQVSALSQGLDGIVGESEAMRQTAELIRRVAPLPTTVLLLGESGTGKELAARAVHRLSPRGRGPFVPVNCAAIAPELIESVREWG